MHVELPLITLIKSNNDEKLDIDFVKMKLRRDTTSENLDLYELKIVLFDKSESEEFLLFIKNFQMTLKSSVILIDDRNIQYICTLVRGEALHHIDTLSSEVGSTNSEHLKYIILVLGMYFPPVNDPSK